jgi:hypothetical protein
MPSFFIDNPEGLTVRQLREAICKIPEIDNDGNEAKVFAACGNLQTSPIKIATLDEDGDLLLVPEFWQEVMESVESWEDFVGD